jgi:hypothetical protein
MPLHLDRSVTGRERLLRRLLAEALASLHGYEQMARRGVPVRFELACAQREVEHYEQILRFSGFADRIGAPV